MVDDGGDADARLEPPSLFRRRKRPAADAVPEPAPEPVGERVEASAPVIEPPPAAEPAPDAEPAPVIQPEPVVEPEPEPVVEPEPEPVVEPEPEPVVEPEPAAQVPRQARRPRLLRRPTAPVRPAPVAEPEPVEPEPRAAPTQPLPAPTPAPTPAPVASSWTPAPVPAPITPPAATEPPAATGELEPAPPREPWLTGQLAAVVTGLAVGVLVVVLTLAGEHVCTALKGTSSCGGPGLFLLVAILLVAVLAGVALLRSAHLPYPGSTSVLAVGLLSVLILLFLVGSIFSWWMIVVIPVFSMGTFAASHWVTTAVVDSDDPEAGADDQLPREQELHDLR